MSALLFIASAGLVLPAPPQRAHAARRAAPTTMLDIPRITLPAAVADPIKDLDLKSPNDLSQAEYNSYSAAAIGGTLIFFILPLFDILGFFGDFVFSALVGGGVGAYASLRKDSVGEYANKFGGALLTAADKAAAEAPGLKDKLQKLVDDIKS
ncbi:hypothetical protein EMIHUDRAFT_454655 [Emiliania huxleyi CCMP1516]|uniref:Uncharacterized protein n=2 Tax=Emiliania huxleyi TaxID=2903 RepID=A0A0D3KRS3_EMIH1|nr:hypothetical protein EMIHUDRAFT_454655 [Emiliania huxleyi CCMP1516]EOD38458.1 hypothetical protein EMIHUDRAFT_454655 [Emiliania huxleyi CCMP1516]|mmetsp:Transcript_48427/g.155892  ORF Transcript_48427/g.155892 Transcript_48427/m.155892 type:complete len:153 (-) Transcript_48427:395-853(-)|eukprot:XP_005790887.1 hypothetical protein EMIHUDRAFT_454655 [Emiliania huxleyi CCMP1516]